MPRLRPVEIATIAAGFALLAWQVTLPGFIGMANNGDFGKVAGLLSIGGADYGAENFQYFKSDYLREPQFYIDFGLPSSEHAIAPVASWIEQRLGDPHTFDIRWLGSLHALLWLAGFLLLVVSLRPLNGPAVWIAAAASVWMFMDVLYAAYMNSFFTDVAALLGAMIAMGALPRLLAKSAAWFDAGAFCAGAMLLVASKGQHAALLVILSAVAILAGFRNSRIRVASFVAAVAIVAAGAWAIAKTPAWYASMNRFSLIFYKLLPVSATPVQDVAELGLAPQDARYIGLHAFLPGSPGNDPAWLGDFAHRGSYGTMLRFYVRHPGRTCRILWNDLSRVAWQNRPLNLSNFRKSQDYPPWTHATRMATWSTLRSKAFVAWPAHIIVWYVLVFIGSPWIFIRSGSPFAGAALVAALLGVTEFLVASLGDAIETERHLLLFHLFTDFTLLFAFNAVRTRAGRGVSRLGTLAEDIRSHLSPNIQVARPARGGEEQEQGGAQA